MALMKKTNLYRNRLEENVGKLAMVSRLQDFVTDPSLKNEFKEICTDVTRRIIEEVRKSKEKELTEDKKND